MSEVLRLHGLGAVVEVRCEGDAAQALAAAMHTAWSRCLVPAPARVQSGVEAEPVAAEPLSVRLDDPARLTQLMMTTTQDITRALIAARVGHLLMFHAGAVSHPETGKTLVYVARGGTGKTTLSRLLGKQLGYLTDETVALDETGAIHPYPKPLSVRRPEEPDLKDEVSPDSLGLLAAPRRPTVARLVLLERRPEVEGVELEEVAFMDALFELVEQSSSLPELSRPLHRLADLIDAAGPVVRLRYREAADATAQLVELIGTPA